MKSTSKEGGLNYEKQIEIYLKNLTKKRYLWKDIPELELRNSGLLVNWNEHHWNNKIEKINNLPDLVTNILQIQCKNFSIEYLADFYCMTSYYDLPGIVFYDSQLSNNLKSLKPFDKIQIKHIYDENISFSEYEDISTIITKNNIQNPYYYQIEEYENLKIVNDLL